MTRFSANLGFLWTDRPLADAIRAAAAAGFDAVECHWPYDEDASAVVTALQATGLSMLGLNAPRGDVAAGENGLAALVGREQEGVPALMQRLITPMPSMRQTFMSCRALPAMTREACSSKSARASTAAAGHGRTILIEPLNHHDAPGYFLNHTDQARRIIEAVDAPNLKLMFDCYHIQILQGDLTRQIDANLDIIGHIQFAGVPSRGRPDEGEVNYAHIFARLAASGYDAPLGAEYKPDGGDTDASLDWMKKLRGEQPQRA